MMSIEYIDKIIKLQHFTIIMFAIVISIIDIKTFRISDKILMLLLSLLIFADLFKGLAPVLSNILSAVIIFTIFFAVFHFVGGMGFGDVKYAAVLSYGLGLKGIYIAMVVTIISSVFLFLVGYFLLGWNKKTKVPFAPLLSVGAISSIIIGQVICP